MIPYREKYVNRAFDSLMSLGMEIVFLQKAFEFDNETQLKEWLASDQYFEDCKKLHARPDMNDMTHISYEDLRQLILDQCNAYVKALTTRGKP